MGTPRQPAPVPLATQQQSMRGKGLGTTYSYNHNPIGQDSAMRNKGAPEARTKGLPAAAPVAAAPMPESPAPIQEPAPERVPVEEVAAPVEPKPLFKYESQKVGPSMRGARAQAANGKSR